MEFWVVKLTPPSSVKVGVLLAAVGSDLRKPIHIIEECGEPHRADEHNMQTRDIPTQHNACYRIIFTHITIVGEYATLEADLKQS